MVFKIIGVFFGAIIISIILVVLFSNDGNDDNQN